MGILLGFVPFIAFSLLTSFSVSSLALWLAFAAAFAIAIRDFAHARLLRFLDVVNTGLFGLLAIYAGFIQPSLSVQALRLIVEAALLAIALISLLRRNPFTTEYTQDVAPRESWTTPQFQRANYWVSVVWTTALAVMTAGDSAATFDHDVPLSFDIGIGLAALGIAIVFTARYPSLLLNHGENRLARN
ncbi:MAG: hypothetical protein HY243_04525 [Proteobacteria bacterium]|nr:hypothetical protein [Pseudomonadota bacterium]